MFICIVGGGSLFTSTSQITGTTQALALSLVPTGLTPVAFFPPTQNTGLQALSVIFLEAPLKKRKKRYSNGKHTYPYLNNDQRYDSGGMILVLYINFTLDFYAKCF